MRLFVVSSCTCCALWVRFLVTLVFVSFPVSDLWCTIFLAHLCLMAAYQCCLLSFRSLCQSSFQFFILKAATMEGAHFGGRLVTFKCWEIGFINYTRSETYVLRCCGLSSTSKGYPVCCRLLTCVSTFNIVHDIQERWVLHLLLKANVYLHVEVEVPSQVSLCYTIMWKNANPKETMPVPTAAHASC